MKYRWTFKTSLAPSFGRKVTVYALDYDDACEKARDELDKRCEKSGEEPPVGWDLYLVGKRIR